MGDPGIDRQRLPPSVQVRIFFFVFDEAACFARGKNLNDRRHAVSALIGGLWPQIKTIPFRGGRFPLPE